MDIDLTSTAVAMLAAKTQGSMQLAVVKKQHEMETALIQMLSESVLAPPPPGQGNVVDKSA